MTSSDSLSLLKKPPSCPGLHLSLSLRINSLSSIDKERMNYYNYSTPFVSSLSKTLDCSSLPIMRINHGELPQPVLLRSYRNGVITMRDRGKNRKPLQRGRVSIETIQTVQSLKRAKKDMNLLGHVIESKFKRLIKSDMLAVLRDLQRQDEALLALQVFEEVRNEYWYKPQVLIYADMIASLAKNGFLEKVELVFMFMKMENRLEGNNESFNALLSTLVELDNSRLTIECFHLMKVVGCDPDRLTFKILINGLESKGEIGLSAILREEAEKYFGGSLEFLEDMEELNLKN